MTITVTKRTEANGMIIESSVSATTDDPYDLAGTIVDLNTPPPPTESEQAAEIADELFASINRSENPMRATSDTGEAVLVS